MKINIKKVFFNGLLIWTPVIITLWVIKMVVATLDNIVSYLPTAWQPSQILGASFFGIGVIFSVIILFVTGLLGSNFIGKRFVQLGESVIRHIPLVKSIYKSVKQVSDTILSDLSDSQTFSQVVLVSFSGHMTIGFITGNPSPAVSASLDVNKKHINVFVPTVPNPTSGYFLFVPEKELIFLDMAVDQALKYVISMGFVSPDRVLKNESKS